MLIYEKMHRLVKCYISKHPSCNKNRQQQLSFIKHVQFLHRSNEDEQCHGIIDRCVCLYKCMYYTKCYWDHFWHTYAHWQSKFLCQFSSESSTFLVYIFKVKIWIEYIGKFIMLLSYKWLLPTNRKSHIAFWLAYLNFTLAHSKGHSHFEWEYL